MQLNELAQLSDSPKPSVTRLVYSKQDIAARKYVVRSLFSRRGISTQNFDSLNELLLGRYIMKLMQDAGLTIRVDAVGNTFGLWEGSDPGAGMLQLAVIL